MQLSAACQLRCLSGQHCCKLPQLVSSQLIAHFNCSFYGAQVMDHYKDFLEARGQGEQAAACEQWDADFDLEALPDIAQAGLPPQPPKV